MPIRKLDGKVAVARLSSLRFQVPAKEVAKRLASWQATTGGFVVPISVQLSRPPDGEGQPGVAFYKDRAKQARKQIADLLGLDAAAAAKLTFTMTSKDAWYLGPRPNLDQAGMLAAVAAAPAKFIELMLQRELIEAAAFEAEDTFVTGGFGPSVYLGSSSLVAKKRLHLAEASFSVNVKHGQLLCDVTSKIFARKTRTASTGPAAATQLAETGEGHTVNVTRLVPDDFFEVDARRHPMVGVSLDTTKFRQTRLYYLNVLIEFALRLFQKAGIPVERDTFIASHCIDDAYIPLDPIAHLMHPLEVVNTTDQSMGTEALKPLLEFPKFFPDGYHVAGNKKAHFQAPIARSADAVPDRLMSGVNYLFLNGEGDEDHGSVRAAKTGAPLEWKPTGVSAAYAGLARGDTVTDPYTRLKFVHLMEASTTSVSMQGLDYSPEALAMVLPGKGNAEDRPLQEALKRCLVELSLKESLLGYKPISTPAMPVEQLPASLTLVATRQIRMPGRQPRKQLVSAVDVRLDERGISVERVRRSPWSQAEAAAIDFTLEFPFLQPDGKEWIRDGQFWMIDRHNGDRLTVWAGAAIVPRIILNDDYAGVEEALASQEDFLQQQRSTGGGRYFSKAQNFNLLPYYMSMYRPGEAVRGERVGTRIPVQDRGAFVRVFVPPEGGINGSGDALSGMRDVMLYKAGGHLVELDLLEQPLVQLYLHTMTNGVLVGGDNSKMSVLEKLARLALEN